MTKDRPLTTLFMLESLDGKISTGDSDALDTDQDFPKMKGVKEGLHQYYELEKWTDIHSLNSGRVFAKIGMNESGRKFEKVPVNFIVIDNKPHLTSAGVENVLKKGKKLYLVTTNKKHPACSMKNENIEIVCYEEKIDFLDLMKKLKQVYGVESLTIQTGGELNSVFLRAGLIDYVSIVVAPALIGGRDTSTLIDGESLHELKDLKHVKSLKLVKASVLRDSYVHLVYEVNN